MRPWLSLIGVVAFAGFSSTCGPGQQPLMGSINYSYGCRQVVDATNPHPSCIGGLFDASGVESSGSPPLIVNCYVMQEAGGTKIRFTIARSSSTADQGEGVNVCGSIGGANQDMNNTSVNLYFNGNNSTNNAAPGVCHVHIGTLGTDSFDGSISCTDAPDNTVPSHLYYVSGVISGTGGTPTTSPMAGDFSFSSCSTIDVGCPG